MPIGLSTSTAAPFVDKLGRDLIQHGRDHSHLWLCVAVPRRSKALHLKEVSLLLESFPLIAATLAVFCFLALAAEERCE
jgi:hypothetical protein